MFCSSFVLKITNLKAKTKANNVKAEDSKTVHCKDQLTIALVFE
jgi:hypothetical protein